MVIHNLSTTHLSNEWVKINFPQSITKERDKIHMLSTQLDIHPVFLYHLFLNGINSEEKLTTFLSPSLKDLHSPFLLNEMDIAIDRIQQAIEREEEIMIFGDYDCDGITSATLLAKGLQRFTQHVHVRLPKRSEGYGLSRHIVETVPPNISLIITVDNGSSAHEALSIAKEKGIDVVVTDHHEVLYGRPPCYAFINPKRSDNTYPFTQLAGAGVALKVIQGLYSTYGIPFDNEEIAPLFELATVGTIADLMPLKDENRVLCSKGIEVMNLFSSPFIKLMKSLLKIKHVDSTSIAFSIAPIFNAMGRMSDPNILLNLLLNNDLDPTNWKNVISVNNSRKEITKIQFQEAETILLENGWQHDSVIVLPGDFHAGIIGLIASRISEKYKKPTIIINQNGSGSARSVNGTNFSIIKVIQECGFLLKRFGGHQAAAGLTIPTEEAVINCFRFAIQESAKKQTYTKPCSYYIGNLNLNMYPSYFFEQLQRMEPFGMGNAKPVFLSQNLQPRFIKQLGPEHMMLGFHSRNAFAFSKGHFYEQLLKKRNLHCLYTANCYEKEDFLIKDMCL